MKISKSLVSMQIDYKLFKCYYIAEEHIENIYFLDLYPIFPSKITFKTATNSLIYLLTYQMHLHLIWMEDFFKKIQTSYCFRNRKYSLNFNLENFSHRWNKFIYFSRITFLLFKNCSIGCSLSRTFRDCRYVLRYYQAFLKLLVKVQPDIKSALTGSSIQFQ